ncbi:RAP94 RNA pol assoc protein [Mythimna separata entomopoxvirus 'L']|uniref:RNA polymerase-associated transcription-specificity factor RAP94 n=1 Tax=Mythimna separata entomopoxvirus 'L' TaxID=1293572 RepID=A0A916P1D6_9POXV|nr:RAP94 RNA pol assoc protein [Mythimna separata entomopoxvirus 'L']CCU56277.1 RAP94 RNA pol assoc protein [Mythimna separata entomopoxvirus 'L']
MEQSEIINSINKIIDYVIDENITDKSINNFILQNKDLYDNIVIYSKILSDKDFKFLYNIVLQYPKMNPNVIYNIYKTSQISITQDININKIIQNKELVKINQDIHTYNYLLLLNKIRIFQPIPKFINVLWDIKSKNVDNLEKINNINTNTMNIISSIENSKVNIIYISFTYISTYIDTHRAELTFNKKFAIYDNLRRIIGVPISNNNYKLNYLIKAKIDSETLIYNIFNSVSFKKIIIYGYGTYLIRDIKNIIKDTVNDISTYIVNNNLEKLYQRMYCCCYFLNCFYEKIFKNIPIETYDKIIYQNTININEVVHQKYEYYECQHVQEYKKVFKDVENFYSNTNKFLENFINIVNKVAICKICGESLDMFNFEEANYIQSKGEIIITTNRENIFQNETYSRLINAELFLTDIISVFDDIFDTNRMDDFNNISRIIIDVFININTNRLEYQDKFRKQISISRLFFIRLSNNLFIAVYNEKEQYAEERQINMFIIFGICLILLCNFNELIGIIKNNKKLKTVFENQEDIQINLNKFIRDSVFIYMTRNRLIDKKDRENINFDLMVDVYLEILTPELKSCYAIILNRFYKNIDILKYDQIELIDLPLLPVNTKYEHKNINIKSTVYNLPLENILNYDNIKIIDKSINYLTYDSVNIKNINNFDTNNINIELRTIIDRIEAEYYYKNISVSQIEQMDNHNFYIDIGQKYFFYTEDILTSSSIILKQNIYGKLLNFADPLPFLNKIYKYHYSILFDNVNLLINYFFPNTYMIFNYDNAYITREYFYYIIYSILINLIDTNILSWIDVNSDIISRLYEDTLKFYVKIIF